MKRILAVGDLHVGSLVSVMPDEVYVEATDTARANKIEANPIQKALYAAWQAMLDDIGKVDACFVLGDSIDGPNRKSTGFELWTSNLNQQVTTAADLLAMIKTRKYYGIQGSFYHVGENTSSDLAVLTMLHGTFGTDLAVTVGPHRIHLAHQIGVSSSPISKATALQGEIVGAHLNKDAFGDFDLIVRAHRHESGYVQNAWGRALVVPGWKLRDAFVSKLGLRTAPQIGYAVIYAGDDSLTADVQTIAVESNKMIREVAV